MNLPLRRLPGHVANGLAVALGIALIQGLLTALAGPHAAQLALSGAIGTSLADVPNTPQRTWRRTTAAALLSLAAAMVAALLEPHPVAMGFGVAAVAFVAMMSMAWGARAGAVSFAPILSLVFVMAVPVGTVEPLALVGWHAVGAAGYVGWAMLSAVLLRRRYRTSAVVGALQAAAGLLRSRAVLLEGAGRPDGQVPAMRAWVAGEALLAERLQAARDVVFAARDSARSARDTAVLLRLIEMRDLLLASRLDLDHVGRDEAGLRLLSGIAHGLRSHADKLDAAAAALRDGHRVGIGIGVDEVARPIVHTPDDSTSDRLPDHGSSEADSPNVPWSGTLDRASRLLIASVNRIAGALRLGWGGAEPAADEEAPGGPFAADDPRRRLWAALQARQAMLAADVDRIVALVDGAREPPALGRAELQRFVSGEGWPLQALRPHLTLRSPVLRHALRAAAALGSAYFIALASPWASHPHWLVLGVAVVLRGNLEQTLGRRNARIGGTLLGCVLVLLLSRLDSSPLQSAVFLAAVATAHAYAIRRYWLTAAAATVMALLQAHLVDPSHGFAIGERVADTLLGAGLAWAFSYVLPSWERRQLPRTVERVLAALREHGRQVLGTGGDSTVELRLSRRQAYDALADLAAALQRSSAEPRAVRVPEREVARLLDHGQRLMAHLSMVRFARTRDAASLDRPEAAAALVEAARDLAARLDAGGAAGAGNAAGASPGAGAGAGASSAHGAADGPAEPLPVAEVMPDWPLHPPTDDALPWLLRRLRLLAAEASSVGASARACVGQHTRP